MGSARLSRFACAAAASAALHGGALAALLLVGTAAPPSEAPAPVSVELAYAAPAGAAPARPAAAPPVETAAPAATEPAQPTATPPVEPAPPAAADLPRPEVAPTAAPPVEPEHAAPTPARPARPRAAPARPPARPPAPVIAQAFAAVVAAPPGPATPGSAGGTSATPSSAWLHALDAWIDAHLAYPEESRRRGEQGSVLVRLTVARDGRLVDFALLRGSGHEELDDATRAMFRNAHLPPAPLASDPPQTTLSKPVRYVLQ